MRNMTLVTHVRELEVGVEYACIKNPTARNTPVEPMTPVVRVPFDGQPFVLQHPPRTDNTSRNGRTHPHTVVCLMPRSGQWETFPVSDLGIKGDLPEDEPWGDRKLYRYC